ncbi:lysine histidine transporter-like 8 [Nicotiana tomentosiformis]|uniref:lysine histidine transporter-like 8 n=1 Tax=Nicotiana tomentosiformis TaxID=4098 RepID=UPI00051BF2CD|nr:lysine histidine transporter-like 8 isoform X1 [Nicotiana tomentosiformis]XP_018630079.1 lysine histidine transporter-like 8 isoform X2 [Nicotiana tomentosiformis]
MGDIERVSSSFSSLKIIPIDNDDRFDNNQSQGRDSPSCMAAVDGGMEKKNMNIPEEVESYLPITESRKGNAYTAAFHLLCSGIGTPALVLPFAFTSLGWSWGIIILTVVFAWRLYTMWLLVHLHESNSGTRYSRYLQLSIAAFGLKLGKCLAIFPIMYLSGGTCVMSIIAGGGTLQLFYNAICGNDHNCHHRPLSGVQWFLLFICLAILIAQFCPNLHSLSWVSFVGSVMGVAYLTLIWALSISKGRPNGVSYNPSDNATTTMARFRAILNGVAIIAIAFRGHNVVLEIQGTLPTNPKHPTRTSMWRGVVSSYSFIAMCIFPLAIGGYWSYGNLMPASGIMTAIAKYHQESTPKWLTGTIYIMVIIQSLCTFQIYAMPVFDNFERIYVSKQHKACPRWVKLCIKLFFGGLTYFISVAFPFLGSLAAFVGGIALPLSLVYPCFMWISIKKPSRNSLMYCLNMILGCLGMLISIVQVAGALWNLVVEKFDANFFSP